MAAKIRGLRVENKLKIPFYFILLKNVFYAKLNTFFKYYGYQCVILSYYVYRVFMMFSAYFLLLDFFINQQERTGYVTGHLS